MTHYPRFAVLASLLLVLTSGRGMADSECHSASASIQARATVVASLGVMTEPSLIESQPPSGTLTTSFRKWLLFQPDDQAVSVQIYSRRGEVVSNLTVPESELALDSLLLALSGAETLARHRKVHEPDTPLAELIVTLVSPDN